MLTPPGTFNPSDTIAPTPTATDDSTLEIRVPSAVSIVTIIKNDKEVVVQI